MQSIKGPCWQATQPARLLHCQQPVYTACSPILRSSANRSIEHTSLTASHYCPGLFLRARRAISSRSIKHELRFPVDQQLLLIHGVHIVQHGSCAAAVALSPGAQACLNEAQRQAMLVGSPAVQPAHILLACLHLGKTSGIVAPGADPSTELHPCTQVGSMLQGAGISTDEAARVLEEGMAKVPWLSSYSGPASMPAMPGIVGSGLTQQVLKQACKLAAAEGLDQAQPVHLLLALLNMTPLPTVLHNPISWVLAKSPMRTELAQVVLYQIRGALESSLRRSPGEQAAVAGDVTTSSSGGEAVPESPGSMTLRQAAQLLGSAHQAGLVLKPAVVAGITQSLDRLLASTTSHSLNTAEWLQLLEGAEAQGIVLPFEYITAALPSLTSLTHSDLRGTKGALLYAICRALHQLGHTWNFLNHVCPAPTAVHSKMTSWLDSPAVAEVATQSLLAAASQQDWQGVIKAVGTLIALDGVLEARGSIVASGLQQLVKSGMQASGREAALVAASHLATHFASHPGGTPWRCYLPFASSLLLHLPPSCSIAVYSAAARGLSLRPDPLSLVQLPACSPAELLAVAEEAAHQGLGLQAPPGQPRSWRGLSLGSQPMISRWWALWRDCVCALTPAFSPSQAARLMHLLAALQVRQQLPAALLAAPASVVTSTSGGSGTLNISTGLTLGDALGAMLKAHLTTLPWGSERSLLVQAATQLLLTIKDPELCSSLAGILREAAAQQSGVVPSAASVEGAPSLGAGG